MERQSKRKLRPKCFRNTEVLGVEFGRLGKCPGGLEGFQKARNASVRVTLRLRPLVYKDTLRQG